MNNRIDQLFKGKLIEHKIAPSAEAWEKVQAGISKKNKLVIVWRMAAVLVLLGVSVGTWYFLSVDETGKAGQLSQINEVIKTEIETTEKAPETITKSVKPNIAKTNKIVTEKNESKNVDHSIESIKDTMDNTVTQGYESKNALPDDRVFTETTLITQTEKPIVIEFTLEAVAKTPVTEVAMASEEENTGLRKILETARDVKNGDSDLGIIRDTKNQLFALDFRKDKTKRN